MKTLKQLLDKFTDTQVLHKIGGLYLDQKGNLDGYKQMLVRLRRIEPIESGWSIHPYKFSTYGTDVDGKTWAMGFTRWDEWLGMSVDTKMVHLQALSYCLWEMSYHGFSQQPIQRKLNELHKRMEEVARQ